MRGTLRSFDSLHFDRYPLRGFERDAISNSMLLFPLFLLLIPKSGPSCLHIGFRWNLFFKLVVRPCNDLFPYSPIHAMLFLMPMYLIHVVKAHLFHSELKIDPLYSLRQHLLIMKCSKDST
ncbi:unnamed protein product [Musa banksii]